ncbi:hypothetical protein V6N12_046461 [Hibiscus sabdariffa]|uniref:Uncharacterized protein n=1 Tax=Hibiscus sabdariffa TaxID=183260 RepID=A0ABR2DJV8_9ROSI
MLYVSEMILDGGEGYQSYHNTRIWWKPRVNQLQLRWRYNMQLRKLWPAARMEVGVELVAIGNQSSGRKHGRSIANYGSSDDGQFSETDRDWAWEKD